MFKQQNNNIIVNVCDYRKNNQNNTDLTDWCIVLEESRFLLWMSLYMQ